MNIGNQENKRDLSQFQSYESGETSLLETDFAGEILAQLETLISGYDREALQEIQAKEKEESDWNALMEAVDRHIELTEFSLEEKKEQALDDEMKQMLYMEQMKREMLYSVELAEV